MRLPPRSVVLAGFLTAAAFCLAPTASAQTLCVSTGPGCFHAIQPAVDAAHDGDTVHVGNGKFAGGVKIEKSIRLSGSGSDVTQIIGGGPVLTLGKYGAEGEPTISIDGVSISHGKTTSSPDGTYVARGGGVFVPPSANFGLGATVKISASTITDNQVAPSSTSPSPSNAPCPGGDCPYAEADGGGIDNWGSLALDHVGVTGNRAGGPLTSDADGGGIYSHQGSLTVSHGAVANNSAISVPPNGRFAEGGGIFVSSGTLTVEASWINCNSVSLTTKLPSFAGSDLIQMGANAGGIHAGDGIPTTVTHSMITGNTVTAFGPNGEPAGIDAAMLVGESPLTMDDTMITGNDVRATYATAEDSGIGGTTIEVDGGGAITNTTIARNTAEAVSRMGVAAVSNGLGVFNFSDDPPQLLTLNNVVIDGNHAEARSPKGTAVVEGGGVFNNSLLELRSVQVTRNSGAAFGTGGHAQGGGIWNGVELSGPPVELTLKDTTISRNSVTGSPQTIDLAGGGLFTTSPVTRIRTSISDNHPNQCTGC